MKYDIAFLSALIPNEIENEVKIKSVKLMEDAAIAWQKHIIQGIEEANAGLVKLINRLPVHAYPHGYRDAFIKRKNFSHAIGAEDISVGFCNIKIIKRAFQTNSVLKEVESWVRADIGIKKILIVYTLDPAFTITIRRIKNRHPNVKILVLVVDMPKLIASSRNRISFISKIYEEWSARQSNKCIKCVDGFGVVTKQMAELLCDDKPYAVIEGISTDRFPSPEKNDDGKIRILYAGLLFVKFGVLKLLEAFSMIDDSDFQLLLCGIGEVEEEIQERAKKDDRIKFLGQLKREDVLKTMVSCDVIVNPRENVGEFTKYSFPSKNLEALSSGIPFIGYKLDGIPDEYNEYINYPQNETVEALSYEMVRVGKLDHTEAIRRAEMAKKWVLKEKCIIKQGEKILKIIDEFD